MRDGREGAARSCARFFAHVAGAWVAGVVCACVCAGMRPEAARWAPTRPRAVEQAVARRDLIACAYQKDNLMFSSLQDSYSRDGHRVQLETHDHPHGTRRQQLKLHAASGVATTCYCSHEQQKCNLSASRAFHEASGATCSLRTLTGDRPLVDVDSKAARV